MTAACERVQHRHADRNAHLHLLSDQAALRVVRYRLRHVYEEPTAIGSEYVDGDFRDFAGGYHFDTRNGATRVTFELRIDPGFRVPGRFIRMLGQTVMGRSLQDLKTRVEQVANGPQ